MRLRAAVLLAYALLATSLFGADAIQVRYQQTVSVPVTGATGAYSLNPFYVEASASEGVLTVVGKNPGSTAVVVITAAGLETLQVTVPQPPPVLPPGFSISSLQDTASTNGTYELRFSNSPYQLENVLDMVRREGDRTIRFHADNANYLSSRYQQSQVVLPALFYEISTTDRDITFIDRTVTNSALTLDQVLVRGFHMRQGGWQFHAGYTTLTSFENLFLPTEREGVVGLSRRFALGSSDSLTGNVYYFPNRSSRQGGGNQGGVGSLVFEHRPNEQLDFVGEAGLSHGGGAASRLDYVPSSEQNLHARVRYEPRDFAGVSANSLHGFLSDGNWDRELGPLRSNLSFTANRYQLPGSLQQGNVAGTWNAQYRLTKHWDALTGFALAHVTSSRADYTGADNYQVPIGLGATFKHFGSTARYSYIRNSGTPTAGNGLRLDLRGNWHGWFSSAYVDRQTQVPTLGMIFSNTPGLQDTLARLGLTALSPQQVLNLLQDEAFLSQLGLVQSVHLNLSPLRLQAGATLGYMEMGGHEQQLNLSFLSDRSDNLQSSFRTTVYSASYSRRLTSKNELFASCSILRSVTPPLAPYYYPVFQVSFRRRFSFIPSFVIPGRTGMISGHVFEDEEGVGTYRAKLPALAEVEVRLDGNRGVHTDQSGRYSFSRVPYGNHQLEVIYRSDRPFYFTTPSRARAEVDSTVDFGIAFTRNQLFGYVRNDAGLALGNVALTVSGAQQALRVVTDDGGKFAASGLAEGEYQLAVIAESVPPGYLLAGIAPQTATVAPGRPTQVVFTLKAVRSVSGRVLRQDAAKHEEGVAGIPVHLRELNLDSTTDGEGGYLFRGLPAGTFTIAVKDGDEEQSLRVTLDSKPTSSRNNDFMLHSPGQRSDPGSQKSSQADVKSQTSLGAAGESSRKLNAATPELQDVFFDFGQHTLRPDQLAVVDADAALLRENPDVGILIAGSCDQRGSEQFNKLLGKQRAETIKQAFVARGIASSQLRTFSFGKDRSYCTGSTPQCWQQNRRVHLEWQRFGNMETRNPAPGKFMDHLNGQGIGTKTFPSQ